MKYIIEKRAQTTGKTMKTLYDWDTDPYEGIIIHMNWGYLDHEIGEHREVYLQGDDAAALKEALRKCDSYEQIERILSPYFDCIEEVEA